MSNEDQTIEDLPLDDAPAGPPAPPLTGTLLVNSPAGAQELVEVDLGGGYFDAERVLWDTRVDGPLPEGITLGAMVRVGGEWPTLATDAALQAATQAAEQAAAAAALQAGFTAHVQAGLDDWAKQKGYDGIVSLCTYVTSTNATFAAQAQRGVDLRDQTWTAGYAYMDAVRAGTQSMPGTAADAVAAANLPALAWEDA